jgi:2-polyprenyl-3-methyl-5-hydroxy-6-metoxy-1,4-benzoquinol methylase
MQDALLSQTTRERISPDSKLALLLATLESDYPIFIPSVWDSYNSNPAFFCAIGEEICSGLLAKFPSLRVEDFCSYYADFTIEQNRHQRAYVRTGNYVCGSHEQANEEVYQNDERMRSYMIVTILTQFLWPHHLAIFQFFLRDFAQAHAAGAGTVIEFAPGHGYFGRKALQAWPEATLTGIDISGEAVAISEGMAAATDVAPRTRYLTGNALDWRGAPADRVIAGELLEHLDQPQMLMDSVFNTLVPGGCAFVTAALTAAHMDHVTEFKTSQEVFDMATKAGLVVENYLEAAPLVVPKNTDKIPRVLAMVLARPAVA